MSEHNDNLISVIKTLLKWKRPILIITIITALGSIGLSLLMPDYYQSTTIFYPASSDLFMADKLFGQSPEASRYYGSPEDLDRMLTVAQSSELQEYLIKKFDLIKRYGIDTSSNKSRYKVYEALMGLYSAKKTKYDAVELTMEDIEPQFAARVANEARNKIADISAEIIHKGQQNVATTIADDIQMKQHILDSITITLKMLRSKYGIYNTNKQSEILTGLAAVADAKRARTQSQVAALERDPSANKDSISMLRSLAKGYESEYRMITGANSTSSSNLGNFNQGVSNIEVLSQIHLEERNQMSGDMIKLNRLRSALNAKISAVHIIEEAKAPLIKSRPKRMFLVLTATLVAFVLSVFGALLINAYRSVNWKDQ
jgi:tyrosine-protein kinase Etk/Wzc